MVRDYVSVESFDVSDDTERRKYERVKLLRPIPGRVGTARVFVIEAGLDGFRLAHEGTLPPVGKSIHLQFEWEAKRLEFDCEIVHNDLRKRAKSADQKSLYEAGVHVTAAARDSALRLRRIVEDHVERALDEQRANARGIPAASAHAYQTGAQTNQYIRCEFINGAWRRTTTTLRDQPPNGFTISAGEHPGHIETLCQNFASANEEGRKMIRSMAELSISKAEGLSTRRYIP